MTINNNLLNNDLQQKFDYLLELDYEELCDYLLQEHGFPQTDYEHRKEDTNATKKGLFFHHIKENIIPRLSKRENIKKYPEYQTKDQLVYCTFLEHLLLHAKIVSEFITRPTFNTEIKSIYSNGFNFLRGLIDKYYASGDTGDISKSYFKGLYTEDYKQFFEKILAYYNGVFTTNFSIYQEMVSKLEDNRKCLVILGCGGGKTSTALGYIKNIYDGNKKALVVCPKISIKDSWLNRVAKDKNGNDILDENGEKVKINEKYVETITYAKLAQDYKKINFSNYSCIVCDEIHHANDTEKAWGKPFSYILLNTNLKIIGLTAEKYKSNGKSVADQIFGDSVVEGKDMAEQIASNNAWNFDFISAIYDMPDTVEEFLANELNITVDEARSFQFNEGTKELYGKFKFSFENKLSVKTIIKTHMPNRPIKGLIFAPTIEEIPEVTNLIKSIYPDEPYLQLNYKMSATDKQNVVNKFEHMDHGFLVSVDMVGEGMHFTGINTLICLRKTKSPLILNQQLGRLIALKYNVPEDPQGIVFDLVNNKDRVTYHSTDSKESDDRASEQISRLKEAIKKSTEEGYSSQKIIKDYAEEATNVINEIAKRLRIKNLNLSKIAEGAYTNALQTFIDNLSLDQQKEINELLKTLGNNIRGSFKPESKGKSQSLKKVDSDYIEDTSEEHCEEQTKVSSKPAGSSSSDTKDSRDPIDKVLSTFINLIGIFTIKALSFDLNKTVEEVYQDLLNEESFRVEYFYKKSKVAAYEVTSRTFKANKDIFISIWKRLLTIGKQGLLPLIESIVLKGKQEGLHKVLLTLDSLFEDDVTANDILSDKMFSQFSSAKYTEGDNLLNPCCGRGTFLKYAHEKLGYPKEHLAGFDIDENYVIILNNLGYTKVICANVFDENLEERLENL